MFSRVLILIICRVMNYSIMLLSPIFLVRILDIQAYGQYREFILYAMLFASFLGFSINSNLLYFIPKAPDKEREYVTHTAMFSFITCLIGVVIIISCKTLILAKVSYDFILPLIFYLFFFLNLDFWEAYWLGKKRSDIVLYYSSFRTLVRMTVVISTAYITRDVDVVIRSMAAVEVVRFVFVLFFFARTKSFSKKLDFRVIKEQLTFIIPLGIASTIIYFNSQVSHLFISVNLGVTFLALYTIGSYQVPILNIIRGSVGHVIFPEMVQRNLKDPLQGLKLWQKTNVISCCVSFPIFVILFFYADIFIKTLFTNTYIEAIPIFRIYLFLMLRQCFEMSSPLRSLNKNKPFILANIFTVAVNLVLMFTLFKLIGLLGPALAFIFSDLAQALYLAILVLKVYKIRIKDLQMWEKVFKIAGVAIICFPTLLLGQLFHINEIFRALVFSVCYLTIYAFIIYFIKFEEIAVIVFHIKEKINAMYA